MVSHKHHHSCHKHCKRGMTGPQGLHGPKGDTGLQGL